MNRILIENKDGIEERLYNEQYGEWYNNPAWDLFYSQYVTICEFVNPTYTLNEINAYTDEMKKMVDVSDIYDAERIYELWRHQEVYEVYSKSTNDN